MVPIENVEAKIFVSECREAASGSSPGWSADELRELSGTRGLRLHQRLRRVIDFQTLSIPPSRNPTDAGCQPPLVPSGSSVLPVATRLNRARW